MLINWPGLKGLIQGGKGGSQIMNYSLILNTVMDPDKKLLVELQIRLNFKAITDHGCIFDTPMTNHGPVFDQITDHKYFLALTQII